MKVIHICQRDDPATGGAVRVAFELVKRLINKGIETRLLFLYGESGYFGHQIDGHCDYLGLKDSKDILFYPRLVKYLTTTKPDVVHHHDNLLWPQLLTLKHPSYKKIIHAHSGEYAKHPSIKVRLLYSCQRSSADRVVAITAEIKQNQCINVGFNPDKVDVIYNGIDLCHFTPSSESEKTVARRQLELPPEKLIAGFVGRLDNAMKGGDDFLRVIAKLSQNWMGLIVGDGPDLLALKELAKDLHIHDRVFFTGLLNDTRIAYQCMDTFCFTSRFEPFGLTIIEAMASGVPVIGFDCPGGSQEILTQETSILVYNRDIGSMASLVSSVFTDREQWKHRSDAALRLLREKFSWEISTQQSIDIYVSLLAN